MALPEYKSRLNYVWQNINLSLSAFAAKLAPYLGGGGGGLTGSNFTVVSAAGTPTENATSLQAAYDAAKAIGGFTATNRYTIVVSPGYYSFPTTFLLDTPYIDVVSLTGNRDVIIDLGGADAWPTSNPNTLLPYINVSVDNIYVRGFDTVFAPSAYWGGTIKYNFKIGNNLSNIVIENCEGGLFSFGGDPSFGSNPQTVSGTFIKCEGSFQAFAGGGTAAGTFIDCYATEGENFGNWGTASGLFKNCEIGTGFSDKGFGTNGLANGTFIECVCSSRLAGQGTAAGYFLRCKAELLFDSSTFTGQAYYCISTSSPLPAVSGGGITMYCMAVGAPDNQGFIATNKL